MQRFSKQVSVSNDLTAIRPTKGEKRKLTFRTIKTFILLTSLGINRGCEDVVAFSLCVFLLLGYLNLFLFLSFYHCDFT
jgi:hypothetical protein